MSKVELETVKASGFIVEEDLVEPEFNELKEIKDLVASTITSGTPLEAEIINGSLKLKKFKVTPKKVHWKELQTEEDRQIALARAEAKRERKQKRKNNDK